MFSAKNNFKFNEIRSKFRFESKIILHPFRVTKEDHFSYHDHNCVLFFTAVLRTYGDTSFFLVLPPLQLIARKAFFVEISFHCFSQKFVEISQKKINS